MGAFYIIPYELKNSAYTNSIFQSFIQRGFKDFKTYNFGNYEGVYFRKIGVDESQTWQDTQGNILILSGTFAYSKHSNLEKGNRLLEDIILGRVDWSNLTGTFCAIVYNKTHNNITFLHDATGVYRFYTDKAKKVVSSSWYALAKSSEFKIFDKDVIAFNLLLGFNPGEKTWLKNIQRVISQNYLPANFQYVRAHAEKEIGRYSNFEDALNESTGLIVKKLNNLVHANNLAPLLGLSSGFDSRLVASALLKIGNKDLEFFTFHKPNDSDPIIAQEIARIANAPLIRKESFKPKDYEQQAVVFKQCFEFLDAQTCVMLQYSKPDYTIQFRKELFGENRLHISGVGGELFRNYIHDPQTIFSIESWIETFFLSSNKISSFLPEELQSSFLDLIGQYLNTELGVSDRLTYYDRKRFYGKLFLRDWHSVRNSAENQYSMYFTPFTDADIINASLQTVRYQGLGGYFEGEMINFLNQDLAKLQSGYGYSFNTFPLKIRVGNFIKSVAKTPAANFMRRRLRKNRKYSPTPFEKDLLKTYRDFDININVDSILCEPTKVEPLLAGAYILKNI